MELPAGGTFVGEHGCGKDQTSFGGRNNESGAPPLPYMACNTPGDDGHMGAIHATDVFPGPAYGESKSVMGVGLGIAYESDVFKIKPEDFVVISINHTAPWTREVGFQIPSGLPACPAGGCHCMWGWVPDPMNVQQMYTLGYRCNVTGAVGREYPAKPQIARKCPFDKNNCTMGAKQVSKGVMEIAGDNLANIQMHYIDQLEGNNNFQAHEDPAFYNYDYGFHDGAQTDIWMTDDGATWNKNTSDLAPVPWRTHTSVAWSTSMNPTWTTTPDSRGGPPTQSPAKPPVSQVTGPANASMPTGSPNASFPPGSASAEPSASPSPSHNVLGALPSPSSVSGETASSAGPTGGSKPTGKCHHKRRLAH